MTTGQAPERDTLSDDDDDDVYYCTGERLKLDARKGDEQDNSGVLLLQRRSGKHDGCGTVKVNSRFEWSPPRAGPSRNARQNSKSIKFEGSGTSDHLLSSLLITAHLETTP